MREDAQLELFAVKCSNSILFTYFRGTNKTQQRRRRGIEAVDLVRIIPLLHHIILLWRPINNPRQQQQSHKI